MYTMLKMVTYHRKIKPLMENGKIKQLKQIIGVISYILIGAGL
jgi:hypothetical protein